MLSQTVSQTVAIHTLPNASTSKGNATTKLCQLIECNMRNIFLEKPAATTTATTAIQILKFYTVRFHCMFNSRTTKTY